MGIVKSYKDLIVWQKSIQLVKEVYKITGEIPESEKYNLISQLRRSSISIPSNIAEGWGRQLKKNYLQFLRVSRGSLFELETQIIIGKELKYINNSERLDTLLLEISKMLITLIKKLEEKS